MIPKLERREKNEPNTYHRRVQRLSLSRDSHSRMNPSDEGMLCALTPMALSMSARSTESKSEAKRLTMRPTGVTSKNETGSLRPYMHISLQLMFLHACTVSARWI